MKDQALLLFAFLVAGLAALVDRKTRRIPNYLSLPLLGLGLLAGLPGSPVLWTYSALTLGLFKAGVLGAGDAKLWLGVLWATSGTAPAWAFPAALGLSGALQLGLRALLGGLRLGCPAPGGWRTLVYLAMVGGSLVLR